MGVDTSNPKCGLTGMKMTFFFSYPNRLVWKQTAHMQGASSTTIITQDGTAADVISEICHVSPFKKEDILEPQGPSNRAA